MEVEWENLAQELQELQLKHQVCLRLFNLLDLVILVDQDNQVQDQQVVAEEQEQLDKLLLYQDKQDKVVMELEQQLIQVLVLEHQAQVDL